MELRRFGNLGLARAVRLLAAALAALTVLRLAIAATTPLAPDEAYYWVWSHALAAGYPDHPPMVALWIRAGTWIAGDGAIGVRLLGPLSAALASLLLVDAGERLLPGRNAGVLAAALLNATLLFGVGCVVMTPDAPLLFFWACCLWAIARWLDCQDARWWLLIGLFAGLALASKYSAAFLWFGIALWLLAVPSLRRCLMRPAPWFGAIVGGAVFLPVLLWNAEHGWTSFARQGGRIADFQPDRAIRFLAELIGGQIGLATPLVFLLCVAGVALATRQAWRSRERVATLLAALTLPATMVFAEHALGDRVQGNWPAIVYPAAALAAAGLQAPLWQRLYRPAIAVGLAITLAVYCQAWFSPLPLPPHLDPIALRLAGWDDLALAIDAARRDAGASFVAADQYGVAAELAHDMPPGTEVIGIERRWSLFDLPAAKLTGRTGILVRTARRDEAFDRSAWSDVADFAHVERRAGKLVVERFRLYRVVGSAVVPDAVVLPRPGSGATASSTSTSG